MDEKKDPQSEPLVMWTVYDRPRDYPNGYIARRYLVTAKGAFPTDEVETSPLLAELRRRFARRGLSCLTRDPADHPTVVETWL